MNPTEGDVSHTIWVSRLVCAPIQLRLSLSRHQTLTNLKKPVSLVLLSGFDGTGELFAPLQAALDGRIETRICRYARERSFDEYVDTAAGMLPQENAVLVAESFSGPIALSLLARYPSRIACAVLCATFAVSPFRTLTRAARYLPTFLFRSSPIQRTALRSFCLNGEHDAELTDQAMSAVRSLDAATVQSRLAVLAGIDVRSLLPRITAPVLYLRATHDRVVSTPRSQELTNALPQVTVQLIDGPHLLLQSRPTKCAVAITDFLARQRAIER